MIQNKIWLETILDYNQSTTVDYVLLTENKIGNFTKENVCLSLKSPIIVAEEN